MDVLGVGGAVAWVVGLVLLAVLTTWLRRSSGRRTRPTSDPLAGAREGPASGVAPASRELEELLAGSGITLYLPADEGQYLAVSRPSAPVPGKRSKVPNQLAAAALGWHAGVQAMLKAGELSGRLVLVDPATAEAIKAGQMLKDSAGNMLGVIKAANSNEFQALSRLTPLSGDLIAAASAGPAILSAIALQAQLAAIEKSIAEVRDTVNAIQGYLEEAERASVEARRQVLGEVYRTARETGQMTQSLWDQIQHLEDPLRRDVIMADGHLGKTVTKVEQGASGSVSSRLKWLEEVDEPLAAAVGGVADARRSLIQFSILRLWWLSVSGDPALASRQGQLKQMLAALPDHVLEKDRVDKVLESVGELKVVHRMVAPRKHKLVAPEIRETQLAMLALPWTAVDVNTARD